MAARDQPPGPQIEIDCLLKSLPSKVCAPSEGAVVDGGGLNSRPDWSPPRPLQASAHIPLQVVLFEEETQQTPKSRDESVKLRNFEP